MNKEYISKIMKYTCPSLLIGGVIFYLCCILKPNEVSTDIHFEHMDKVVHFLMYFGLSFVASFGYIYGEKGRIIILKMIVFAFILPILYGGLIEVLQYRYFEGRSGDWFDFLADFLGSLAVLPLALYFRRYLLNNIQND